VNINLEYIKTFNPCSSGVNEYIEAGYENFSGTVLEFLNLNKVSIKNRLWVVLRPEIISENDLHELACKFAESVLHIFEKEYPEDKRPRLAIEAKRKWLKKEITDSELDAARVAVWNAARDAASAARAAAWAAAWETANAARAAARVAANAARDAAWEAANAARDAASAARDAASAARAAAWNAARAATEEQKQLDIVIDYFSELKMSNKKLTFKDDELEREAYLYCDKTGSMYFDYTEASNELIDAFMAGAESGFNKAQKEAMVQFKEMQDRIDELEEELNEHRKYPN
jgi:chemotaxis protein histidine kinase CheA